MKPFDLGDFKAGQKALTRSGQIATYIGFCPQCVSHPLIAHVDGNTIPFIYTIEGCEDGKVTSEYDLVSMVSRHQCLIDSYDPEDTWQVYNHNSWLNVEGEPSWCESFDYRIHPHNGLIKAQRNGAIIEKWVEAHRPCWFTCYGEPDWDERATYRVMPEEEKTAAFMRGYTNTLKILNKPRGCRTKAKTKTVYEWMWKNTEGYWLMADILSTEEEAANYYAAYEHKKTGRSWKVEV